MIRALLLLCLVSLLGCASIRHYERALPKRVDVDKKTGEPTVRLGVDRLRDGSLEVWAVSTRPVEVSRTMVFQTSEIRYEWNPLGELIEIPFGLAIIPASAILMALYPRPPDEANIKGDYFWWVMSWIFAPINPFQSLFFPSVERNPHSDVEVFVDDPVITEFNMSTPERDLPVRFVFTNSQGAEVERGQTKTDLFGCVLLTDLPQDAAWLVVKVGGEELRYRVARDW